MIIKNIKEKSIFYLEVEDAMGNMHKYIRYDKDLWVFDDDDKKGKQCKSVLSEILEKAFQEHQQEYYEPGAYTI